MMQLGDNSDDYDSQVSEVSEVNIDSLAQLPAVTRLVLHAQSLLQGSAPGLAPVSAHNLALALPLQH